jgi:hypothetical protein
MCLHDMLSIIGSQKLVGGRLAENHPTHDSDLRRDRKRLGCFPDMRMGGMAVSAAAQVRCGRHRCERGNRGSAIAAVWGLME